ncbi:IS630 family transposase [Microcoleus sp. N9_B4]|uniref:IS630 family transposase n=1 Tax=Microcoleus sp. N9_B4 TaxID=3055386 RepID=UPI002FD05A1B
MNNLKLPLKDMEKEITQLESFIKSDIDARELKRAIAVRMAVEGKFYHEISKILGVSEFFVGHWKKQFQTKGIEGIKLGHKGSKGYLTALQKTEVIEWLKNKEYWNLDELVTYVEREFGVIYKSKQSYYELFDRAKISWKKTQKINPKFDEELVKKKTEEINNILFKNKAGIESGQIIVLFIDECHLLHGDLTGYVWGQSKIRIEVPITNEKDRQTYFGALNYQSKEFHVQSHPSGDGKSTVKFIKYLQDKYKNRKIILIWDGASYHKYGEFRDFLLEVNADKEPDEWSITCILFAPNAPQQNPVEDIWLQAKNFLRKYWYLCRSFKIVKFLFEFFTNEHKFDFPKIHKYNCTEKIN